MSRTVSGSTHSFKFLKKCSGIIGVGAQGQSISGTANYSLINGASITYTDTLYNFSANVNDTIIFSAASWSGYEIIGT